MGRNDGLLSFKETMALLNVGRRHLGNLVREGYIRPVKIGKQLRSAQFRSEEVHALVEIRARGTDLPKIAAMAQQARALSLSNAATLEKLCVFLGLDNNRLRTDEDSVFMLHMKVQDALKTQLSDLTAGAVLEWSAAFNGIDEGYLELLESFTRDPQPWAPYLELANQMMANQNERTETNLKFAYACLDTARRHLRHVGYFYVLTKAGERAANNVFIKGQVDDEVIAQLYPMLDALTH